MRNQELTALNEPIEIIVDWETVEGRISFLRFNDIRVEITYPFSQASMALHIAFFALPYIQYEQDTGLTPRGRQVAEQLLKEIYETCAFCEANENELIVECLIFMEQSTWSLLRNALANADFSEGWYLCPLFMLLFFLTDWEMIQSLQDEIKQKFGRKLPEDLLRGLLAQAKWLADQG